MSSGVPTGVCSCPSACYISSIRASRRNRSIYLVQMLLQTYRWLYRECLIRIYCARVAVAGAFQTKALYTLHYRLIAMTFLQARCYFKNTYISRSHAICRASYCDKYTFIAQELDNPYHYRIVRVHQVHRFGCHLQGN